MSFEFKCAEFKVRDDCQGVTLDFTQPVRAVMKFTSDSVLVGTFMLTLAAQQVAADMTVLEAKGLNAFRCAATSMFENISNLTLAMYYALLEFDYDYLIKEEVIDAYYPNICTCKYEIEEFGKYISGGQDNNETNAKYIGTCSESAQP